jgi:hypothetical protein
VDAISQFAPTWTVDAISQFAPSWTMYAISCHHCVSSYSLVFIHGNRNYASGEDASVVPCPFDFGFSAFPSFSRPEAEGAQTAGNVKGGNKRVPHSASAKQRTCRQKQ